MPLLLLLELSFESSSLAVLVFVFAFAFATLETVDEPVFALAFAVELLFPVPALADAAPPNPHPCFPFWKFAFGPEQIPQGLAQQLCWQSASLKHWPPTNWTPAPLPMFLTPEGSKGGQRFWRDRRTGLVWEMDGEKPVGLARVRDVKRRAEME